MSDASQDASGSASTLGVVDAIAGTEAAPAPLPEQDVSPRPGLRIDRYELVRLLGRGGMGQVYLARDTVLARMVAIKFLNVANEQIAERFLVEARATARCRHENIVVIHEVNNHAGYPYMVLEHLQGKPLSAIVGRSLPLGRAVELMVPVVRALVRAHEFDIVHRDLKPDNVFLTDGDGVKVLDFGIAKMRQSSTDPAALAAKSGADSAPTAAAMEAIADVPGQTRLTKEGARLGTVQYMAPEQWRAEDVDARADIWAVGLMLYQLVSGKHPFEGKTPMQLMTQAALLDEPVPSIAEHVPQIATDLERVIDRCLAKRVEGRYQSAAALLEVLEPLRPARHRELSDDESPYPGLVPFQEADAGRFFGRSRDIALATSRIRERPLVGVVGVSGVGKSSFVQAGLVPHLKLSGEPWEVLRTRPGRQPFASLAGLLQSVTKASSPDIAEGIDEHEALQRRLQQEPGYFGAVLRQHAHKKQSSVLLFVDQLEELYTLVPDEEKRKAFTACLRGVADDASAPLRVVIAMRSDLLDRAAEDQRFVQELARGLVFLQPPGRDELEEALVQPLELSDYRFERPAMVTRMLDALVQTTGALPLMQFAANKLWDSRDSKTQMLTESSFRAMGGVAGALSTHADATLAALPISDQKLVRTIFMRLITDDGTRALVDTQELLELPAGPEAVQRVIDLLVQARLLVIQSRSEAEGPAIEIVHESLIHGWSTLRHWVDEDREATAFLTHLRNAARQWDARGRPQGLLWTADAEADARSWARRYLGELPAVEQQYLDAVFALSDRTRSRRRTIFGGLFVAVVVVALGALIALLQIRQAESLALDKAAAARRAEKRVRDQLTVIKQKERQRATAERAAKKGQRQLQTAQTKLEYSYAELKQALTSAQSARRAAQESARKEREAAERVRQLADAERKARTTAEKLLTEERRRLTRLRKRITTELKK